MRLRLGCTRSLRFHAFLPQRHEVHREKTRSFERTRLYRLLVNHNQFWRLNPSLDGKPIAAQGSLEVLGC